jgi:uncharacterized protein (DUF1778 family)
MSVCSPTDSLPGPVLDDPVSSIEKLRPNFCFHPQDYRLIEAAAHARGLRIDEFIELAAYLCAKEIIVKGNDELIPENHNCARRLGSR